MAIVDNPVLNRFRAALGDVYGERIERVVLFGSRARGGAHRADAGIAPGRSRLVTPETRNYLDKARIDLSEARKIASIGLATAAAHSAYYVAFHAAEAFISERTGKIAKTHSGVRAEFSRLANAAQSIDRKFTTFLAQAYMYKEIVDYSVEPGATVTMAEARDAILIAAQFIDCVTDLLMAPPP